VIHGALAPLTVDYKIHWNGCDDLLSYDDDDSAMMRHSHLNNDFTNYLNLFLVLFMNNFKITVATIEHNKK